jgi:DNA-binding CsgD family transcriptional regulator
MKNAKKTVILLYFLSQFFVNAFSQKNKLEKIETEQKIASGLMMYRDLSNREGVFEVKKKNRFILSEKSIPDFYWGKFTGWIKFELESDATQNLILQVHNPLFEEIKLYVFEDEKLIIDGQSFSNFKQPQDYRFPNFRIPFQANKNYEIYLSARAKMNPIKFPLRLLSEKGHLKLETRNATEFGFLMGFSVLVIFLNALIGFIFRVRIFWILSLAGSSFMALYLFLEGFLFNSTTIYLFDNPIFNTQYFIFYLLNFLSLITVWLLYRVHLSKQFIWRRLYLSILITLFIIFGFTFFSPLWYDAFSNESLLKISILTRGLPLISQIFMIAASIRLFREAPISKWYLVAILPSILSYAIPRFLSKTLSDFWLTLPQIYFYAMIWYVLILSIGFIVYLSKNYLKTNIKTEEKVVQVSDNQPVIKHEVLSKREIEILKAFANGFTYQEISDAMFISPNTVRTHLKNIYQKLEINSKAEAIRYVIERGW